MGLDEVGVPADHDRHRARDRAGFAPAHRGVDGRDAGRLEFGRHLPYRVRADGAHVDVDEAVVCALNHAVLAEGDLADVLSLREERDEHVARRRDRGRGRPGVGTVRLRLRDPLLDDVVDDQAVARVQQVLRRRQPHEPEADESDRPPAFALLHAAGRYQSGFRGLRVTRR